MAGYVEVTPSDIRRLARHLKLSEREFEARHIVRVTRAGKKRIKAGYETCQFLGDDRRCTVYEARPENCRGYYCWDQPDETLFEFARFFQTSSARMRALEAQEAQAEKEAAKLAAKPRKRGKG